MIFCIKQLSLNTKQNFGFPCYLIDGERLLSVVIGVVRFLADKLLDFHDTIFSVLPSLLKCFNKRFEILSKVLLQH